MFYKKYKQHTQFDHSSIRRQFLMDPFDIKTGNEDHWIKPDNFVIFYLAINITGFAVLWECPVYKYLARSKVNVEF